jgi:hypothetical protein
LRRLLSFGTVVLQQNGLACARARNATALRGERKRSERKRSERKRSERKRSERKRSERKRSERKRRRLLASVVGVDRWRAEWSGQGECEREWKRRERSASGEIASEASAERKRSKRMRSEHNRSDRKRSDRKRRRLLALVVGVDRWRAERA